MPRKEIWKSIIDFPKYEVSNSGKVRNAVTRHVLKPWVAQGYETLRLWNNTGKHSLKVHRLVAGAFLKNPLSKPEVNHIDGNKLNNFAKNLEWCTSSENTRHAISTGLFTPYKLPPYQKPGKRVKIVETGEVFESLTDCAKHIHGFKTAVSACLRGKVKSHMGYHFEEIRD